MGKNLGKIIFLNAVGLTIFFSWYLPAEHGFWFTLDKSIFYYFNEQLQPESSFTYFVGLTNVRHFRYNFFNGYVGIIWLLLF